MDATKKKEKADAAKNQMARNHHFRVGGLELTGAKKII